MANILTASEAATVLRCEVSDPDMLGLLPLVDAYLYRATGHDWSKDSSIQPEAKSAARILLTVWHENPGMTADGSANGAMGFGLRSVLVQLEALALRYQQFIGNNGAGGCDLPKAKAGETVSSLVGLIGLTGDQSAKFETVISVDGQIQQIHSGDLSANYFRAYLVPVEGL
jgi:hypothetical protein